MRNLFRYSGGLASKHKRSLYTDLAGDLLRPNSADMVMDAQGQDLVQNGAQKSLPDQSLVKESVFVTLTFFQGKKSLQVAKTKL